MDGVERQVRPDDEQAEQSLRLARLAELMVHITECSPVLALSAVTQAAGDERITNDNALDVLARAISTVRASIDLRDEINLRKEVELASLRPATSRR